jgi:hypothetical protein
MAGARSAVSWTTGAELSAAAAGLAAFGAARVECAIADYGGEDREEALGWVDTLAYHVPIIGAVTTRNVREILELLEKGHTLVPGPEEYDGVVRRGSEKLAPLHRTRTVWPTRC